MMKPHRWRNHTCPKFTVVVNWRLVDNKSANMLNWASSEASLDGDDQEALIYLSSTGTFTGTGLPQKDSAVRMLVSTTWSGSTPGRRPNKPRNFGEATGFFQRHVVRLRSHLRPKIIRKKISHAMNTVHQTCG